MDYIKEINEKISIKINDIKYSNKTKMLNVSKEVTVGWRDILPEPPSNNSETTLKELKYLEQLTKSLSSDQKNIVLAVDKSSLFVYDQTLLDLNLEFPKEDYEKSWNILKNIIMNIKYIHNRPRPYQIANYFDININVTETKTHHTPAYPSGHTAQAALAAYLLAAKYPEHSGEFFDKVGLVGNARCMQGVHYPSDNEASMIIVGAVWEDIRYKLFPEYKQF